MVFGFKLNISQQYSEGSSVDMLVISAILCGFSVNLNIAYDALQCFELVKSTEDLYNYPEVNYCLMMQFREFRDYTYIGPCKRCTMGERKSISLRIMVPAESTEMFT